MKNYFVFYINESFSTYYKNKPSILFKIFDDLFHSESEDQEYALRQFDQLKKDIKVNKLNDYLYKNLSIRPDYRFVNGVHIIDNEELGIFLNLLVKENFIHISTNDKYNIVVDLINSFSRQFFIINFDDNFYSWIKDLCNDLVTNSIF